MNISLISAMTQERVIGCDEGMPWHIPEELQYFKAITMGKPMVMGRATFDAIGRRVLPGRTSIVLTRDKQFQYPNVLVAHSVQAAIDIAGEQELMVIGGAQVYQAFFPLANKLYLSIIDGVYSGDVFFPAYDENQWMLKQEKKYAEFTAKIFEKI